MSTGTAPKETLPITPDQKESVGRLASATKLVSVLFLLFGVIQIVGGPYSWFALGGGIFAALLMLVQGVLCLLLGLVMLAVSSDFGFLGQLPQYSGNHLRNVAKNLTMFHKILVGLAVLIAILALMRNL